MRDEYDRAGNFWKGINGKRIFIRGKKRDRSSSNLFIIVILEILIKGIKGEEQ